MSRRDSYARIAAQILALAGLIAALAAFSFNRRVNKPTPPVATIPSPKRSPSSSSPKPKPKPAPRSGPGPIIDHAAVAKADESLEAAKRDRARAEVLAEDAAERLKVAQTYVASAWMSHKKFAAKLRDPGPRLISAKARGELVKAERDPLRSGLLALEASPKPRRKALIDKSPVAQKSDGEEYHFELRGDRVAFIDLERLLDRVKSDARAQIRINGNSNRPVGGEVGPVGAFSMRYSVGRVDDDPRGRIGTYGLTGWEIVPNREGYGEVFESAIGPASDFSRAINRLDASHDVVTMWIYPDAFPLYRKLRDSLHARGFRVAARPLPQGMKIKGSPSGSASAAQ